MSDSLISGLLPPASREEEYLVVPLGNFRRTNVTTMGSYETRYCSVRVTYVPTGDYVEGRADLTDAGEPSAYREATRAAVAEGFARHVFR